MRQRYLAPALTGLIVALLAWPGSAAATGVAPAPERISAASSSVSPCGSLSGVGIAWTVTADTVTTVVLTAIPAACVGGSLSLTLIDATNAPLGTAGPVTVTGTTQTFTSLTGAATATSVAGAYVSVVGP
jgi:hypothetical protein